MTEPNTDRRALADAHVALANKIFRDSGFTIAAMQYPRSPEALVLLKKFNGLPDDARAPFAWSYYPNAWCRDNTDALMIQALRGRPDD